MMPNHEKNGYNYENPCLCISMDELWFMENGAKKKLFLQNQSINIMYLNVENMVVVSNHKKNGDYYENASLTYFTNELWLHENLKKQKLFLQLLSLNIIYPNGEHMIVVPIKKEWRLLWVSKFMSFHGWTLTTRKMVERKDSYASKASILCIPMRRTWL